MIDKTVIRNNFSRFAHLYDSYSSIQRLCAERLISINNGKDFKNILDIGCGTGHYTVLLRKRFPFSLITAVDISKEMIKIAQNKLTQKDTEFIIADAENFDFQKSFDFISSNVSLQWFDNLEAALRKYQSFLKPKGIIQFSIFGPRTFWELQESLEDFFSKKNKINSSAFLNQEKLETILKNNFKKIKVEEVTYQESYYSLVGLLEKIKYTGARGRGIADNNLWTTKTVTMIEERYKDKFREIKASYQVFFCRGVK
ncbi:MAG: malonyl-ACP O-methyltransferase BioC [Candidatus Omnitrophica bacterium]|jgi:malonyl-CoA O-methyltransferase|nr:malonyl-ACP O-methyltransferase BioC [Candidatus Omnitrophota bacterium]